MPNYNEYFLTSKDEAVNKKMTALLVEKIKRAKPVIDTYISKGKKPPISVGAGVLKTYVTLDF